MKIYIDDGDYICYCTSGDTKPTPEISDDVFGRPSVFLAIEQDTGKTYYYDTTSSDWVEYGSVQP